MQKSVQAVLQRFHNVKLSSIWTKRIFFIGILICVLLYYFVPFYQNIFRNFSFGSSPQSCMKRYLLKSNIDAANFDAVINNHPFSQNEGDIPFVGNGKLGAVVSYEQPTFYILHEDKDSSSYFEPLQLISLPLNMMVFPEHVTSNKDRTMVLNYRHGIVEQLTCFSLPGISTGCVFINHTLIAHRSRPNLFLQHIEAKLDDDKKSHEESIILRHDLTLNSPFREISKQLNKQYKLYGATIKAGDSYMAIIIAMSSFPPVLHIRNGAAHADIITIVMHSDLTKSFKHSESAMDALVNKIKLYSDEVMGISGDVLLTEHKSAWNDILHTGLTVSPSSDEPQIPSPKAINSTLYYILSMMDSKLHDTDIPQSERSDLMKRLQTPNFCYNTNPTINAAPLWVPVSSVQGIRNLVGLWIHTLRIGGCSNLISEGAEGMLQAIVLSFIKLQFTMFDLQLHAHPDILHHEMILHRVMYQNNTIDITVHDVEGVSTLEIALRGSSPITLYACEAGCQSPAVVVSKQPRHIPIYVTEPLTPILYISHEKKHLEKLKASLHVRKIIEHAEHMEAKRKGGLPTIFWFSIGTLIILFHLCLIRIIFKEYNTPSITPPSKTYYTNRGRLAS